MTDREKEIYWRGFNDGRASVGGSGLKMLLSKQQKIQNTVCEFFGVTMEQLKEPNRRRTICYPRQMLCYFLANKTTMGCVKISRLLQQNHTSVLASIKQIKNLMQTDEEVVKDVDHISAKLRVELEIEVAPPMLMDKIKKISLQGKGVNAVTFFHRPKSEYSNTGHINFIKKYSEVS